MQDFPTLQHRWFQLVWNEGREDLIDDMLTCDCIGHGLRDEEGNEIVGSDGFKAFFQAFRAAFPDIRVDVIHTVTENDFVSALCEVTATHTGYGFFGAPTNRSVNFTGQHMIRVADGKIAESWNHWDFGALQQQLTA